MPHLLRQDCDGLFFRDSGAIALDPGRLRMQPYCWSNLSQFRAGFPAGSSDDTE
jgi:hypothetical protein